MAIQPQAAEAAGSRTRTRWWLLAVIAVVVLVPAVAIAETATREPREPIPFPFALDADGTAVDLGTLTGGSGWAEDVNSRGDVAGAVLVGEEGAVLHAFFSHDGRMTDLGTLGLDASYATALNDAGWVVGVAQSQDEWRAFVWDGSSMRDLGTLEDPPDGKIAQTTAVDINERGQIVGYGGATPILYRGGTMAGSADESGYRYVGFVWEDGRTTRLETPEAMLTMPVKINEKGQILGTGRVVGSGQQHVLLWDSGEVTDLGEGWAIALNDRGQAVFGRMETPGSPQLWYLWEEGRLTRIKGVDGPDLRATDLNNNGIVAGFVEDADKGTQRAATWQAGTLTFLDLKARDSGAEAINDAGMVVGSLQR
ncbi:MAG: hypothetical protein ACYC5Q_02325 [Thermoleophilia bacterium]